MIDEHQANQIKRSREEALGGTGKVSGADPVADKQIPAARPQPHAPRAPPAPALDQDSEHAIPLNPPRGDGS